MTQPGGGVRWGGEVSAGRGASDAQLCRLGIPNLFGGSGKLSVFSEGSP